MSARLAALARCISKSKILGDERGSIIILGGVMLALMAAVSIAVIDVGSIYLEKRRAQGVLDIATQLAAQDIDHAEAVVRAVLAKNGIGDVEQLDVVLGRYIADPSVAPAARFVADTSAPNALRVYLRKPARVFFAKSLLPSGRLSVGVTSVGAQNRETAFSIGSRLLQVQGGVLNALLSALLGGSVSLSAVDYNGLADAQVDVLDFLDALAVEAGVTAGSYDQLLNTEVGVGALTAAISAALGPDQSAFAISAAAKLADATRSSSLSLKLGDAIDLGTIGDVAIGGETGGLGVGASALSLLAAAAGVSDGEHQLSLDLGASIPGLLSTIVDVEIGERPQSSVWLRVGDEGTVVRTAQVRVGVRVTLGGSGLLSGTSIALPVAIEVAPAEARFDGITCSAAREPTVTISAKPGVVSAWIATTDPWDLASFSDPAKVKPATLVSAAGLVSVTGQAHVAIDDLSRTTLVFDSADISERRAKTVSTDDITSSLTAHLLKDLSLQVKLGPLSLLSVSFVKSQLVDLLGGVTGMVDDILGSVLELLGVKIGAADVWVNGAYCGRPGLVG